jgi:hypothetical protein
MYCAERPKIDPETFIIGGQPSGTVPATIGENVRAGFNYVINPEQQPLKSAQIVWCTSGCSDPEAVCESAGIVSGSGSGKYNETKRFSAGTYYPIACVKDNWEAVGFLAFPGTVVAE